MSKTAYLSLGSNIGDRLEYLTKATQRLNDHLQITVGKISSVYETKAWGLENQDDFYNIALEIATTLEPLELLSACQKIEAELNRIRKIHWGPRTIDIDILLYDNLEIASVALTIPHPYLLERPFVTTPLTEISPEIMVKGIEVSSVATTDGCVLTSFRIKI